MLLQPILLGLAVAVQSVLGAPAADISSIEARKVIGHDKVPSFRETAPHTTQGNLILKFKPYLKVFNGCTPFPAVDGAGNVGYVKTIISCVGGGGEVEVLVEDMPTHGPPPTLTPTLSTSYNLLRILVSVHVN